MDFDMKLIPMALVDRPVKISRETIDPESIRELAESIREKGLLQPIIVRPVNGRYEVVAGDRRFLSHKMLGLKEIRAVVSELDDTETIVIRGIENLQRVDLSPSEEGRVYLLLRDEAGLSLNAICKKTGKALNTVSRYMRFAQCSDEVRRAVDLKQVSLLTLETLQEIDDPEMFEYHFKMAAQNGITAAVARLWVDDYNKTKTGTYYDGNGGNPSVNVEVEAKPTFMTCEVCHGACEIRLVRSIVACPDCLKKVRHP